MGKRVEVEFGRFEIFRDCLYQAHDGHMVLVGLKYGEVDERPITPDELVHLVPVEMAVPKDEHHPEGVAFALIPDGIQEAAGFYFPVPAYGIWTRLKVEKGDPMEVLHRGIREYNEDWTGVRVGRKAASAPPSRDLVYWINRAIARIYRPFFRLMRWWERTYFSICKDYFNDD